MALKIRNMNITCELPEIPSSLQVFKVTAASLEDRKKAISVFSKQFNLSKPQTFTTQDSIHFVTRRGEIQYYRPSGALWVRNTAADRKFRDERRPWKTVKVPDKINKEDFTLGLSKDDTRELAKEARTQFKKTALLGKGSYLADVSLDQVAQLNEKGEVISQSAGEATVKFHYKLKGMEVDGAGAKSYAYFNPGRNRPELVGIFHAWRELAGGKAVKMTRVDEALTTTVSKDKEIKAYREHKYKITLTKIDLVYYSLPAFMFQEYVFPALRLTGSVYRSVSRRKRKEGFEFIRHFHVARAKDYIKAGFGADYLFTSL